MIRRIALVTGLAAALMVPAASALAVDVNHPGAKAGGCGVENGTVSVMGSNGWFYYTGGGADLEGCW